ncbi:MAG: riboflavin synthase [Flavobacteriales bacterium]|nr:riboflavin synthase [Flavobacteriales bacterium]|tara:strand:+ start:10350 stop:10937 length:588 start_codon:yes stop_codon:yes gene_type:complete
MFTGIIEQIGLVSQIDHEKGNTSFTIEADFVSELKIDQSIAHNGVCLTIVALSDKKYTVTAIKETLDKTNLRQIKLGDFINLERCMKLGSRLDGHIVQGHVDKTAICTEIIEVQGSWVFKFKYQKNSNAEVTVEKGSITINGTSLTVVNSMKDNFSVCIIPYTYENTCFKFIKEGDKVNLEFDIIGKYVARIMGK